MWQQISSKLQSISTHENRLTDLQQQQGKSQTLSQQVLLLQQQLEQEQQQLKEWLAQQRERRVEQQRLTRQQQLQEQLQDDLIIGTQGLKYPSLFGTDEISYHELQELIRQEFAARFMGDGATLAALHVPKYWVLSDAAVAELVQWVWEERLNQLLQEQRLHKAGAPEQLMLQPTVQDPLRGMLCMHHNISKGLAGVVAAHARPTAQQAIHKFLQELAQQQQADTDRFEQLRQRYADSQIDGAELAKQEYQFGVEWRYQLYRQRRLFKLYQVGCVLRHAMVSDRSPGSYSMLGSLAESAAHRCGGIRWQQDICTLASAKHGACHKLLICSQATLFLLRAGAAERPCAWATAAEPGARSGSVCSNQRWQPHCSAGVPT